MKLKEDCDEEDDCGGESEMDWGFYRTKKVNDIE